MILGERERKVQRKRMREGGGRGGGEAREEEEYAGIFREIPGREKCLRLKKI